MAFKLVKGFDQAQPMYCAASSAVVKDQLLCFDVSAGAGAAKVIPATASLLSVNVAGVCQATPATGDTFVPVIPIVPGQLWEWDTTSATLTTHLNKPVDLTDGLTVANSTTISTAATAFVKALENVGATGDKKQRGMILGMNLPKALS